jgi:hypothetical protein
VVFFINKRYNLFESIYTREKDEEEKASLFLDEKA